MEPNDVLAIGGAIVALGAAVLACLPWLRGALNARAFTEVFTKLAEAGNAEGARKLCAAAPGAPFVLGTAAALDALHEAPDGEQGADFLRKAFRAPIRAWIDRASQIWIHVAVAAGGSAAAIALPRKSVLPASAVLAVLAVMLFAYVWRSAKRLATDTVEQGDKLVGALIESRAAKR